MSAALVPRCCSGKAVFAAVQGPLKGCSRLLCTGRPSWSAADVAAAERDSAAGAVKPYEAIPGPKPLPIVGNAIRFIPFIGEFGGMPTDDLYEYLYEKYGPIVKIDNIPGRSDLVFCYRPEDVETVYRNEGPWPHREKLQSMDYFRHVLRKDFYEGGGSILTENGKKWGESRRKVNQPMMQPKISKMYVPRIAEVAQEFVDKIISTRDKNEELPANFMNELSKWALESIAYVALDARLGCLEPNLAPDSEQQRIIHAVNTALDNMYDMEVGTPLWRIIKTPAAKKFFESQDFFVLMTVKYVRAAIDRYERRKEEGLKKDWEPSVLERLLARTDVKTASIMAQDMLLAGIDTTANTTAIAMYYLARHQDKQEVLFQELKRDLPHKDTPFTEEKLEEMRYLKAVIKESMRMMPIVNSTTRNTTKAIVVSNYRVPEGVSIVMPNITYRFDDSIYPQSKRFIPERWLKERPSGDAAGNAEDFDAVRNSKRNPFTFLPFGFGPRSCVGKRFAELEMEILLAKMVRNYRVDFKYGDLKPCSRLLNVIKEPLKFKLTERRE